jgi:hypothetical protein
MVDRLRCCLDSQGFPSFRVWVRIRIQPLKSFRIWIDQKLGRLKEREKNNLNRDGTTDICSKTFKALNSNEELCICCGPALVSMGMRIQIQPFYLNADPDPESQINADPDPGPGQMKVTKCRIFA